LRAAGRTSSRFKGLLILEALQLKIVGSHGVYFTYRNKKVPQANSEFGTTSVPLAVHLPAQNCGISGVPRFGRYTAPRRQNPAISRPMMALLVRFQRSECVYRICPVARRLRRPGGYHTALRYVRMQRTSWSRCRRSSRALRPRLSNSETATLARFGSGDRSRHHSHISQ
jgi:hypothetical protein